MDEHSEGRRRIGLRLERERLGRNLTQGDVARELGIRSEKSIYSAEKGQWVGSEPTRTAKKLATYYGWTPESIYRVRDGGDPTYATAPARPSPMAREVKAEWRRKVEASPMSAAAKRENLAFIDTIPDAD